MFRLNLILRLLVCLIFIFLPLGNLDEWLYDQFFNLRGTQQRETPIVLLRVSDAKVYQLLQHDKATLPPHTLAIERGNLSFWLEPFHSDLIRKIKQANPQLIIFTQFYDWVDHRTLSTFENKNIIFSGTINDENRLVPPTRLTLGENYGFNNLFPDSDNVIRQSYLYYSYGASLALSTQKALSSDTTTRDLFSPLRIDFRGPQESFPSYNAWDIFNADKIDPSLFRNKIVLIGKEGSPASDVNTPFGKMPRLEVQANLIDTFINHHEIKVLPQLYSRICAALSLGISAFIVLYYPINFAWVMILLFCGVVFLIDLFMFAELKLWLGFSNIFVSIFGTHLIFLGYTLRRQEEANWLIEQESKNFRELDQFKNNFISLFSHDLKTPIAKIKAITHRLIAENKELSSQVVESLKNIDRTSGDLSRLISDILKITRLESMSMEASKEVIDLNRLVETCSGELKFLADEKQIRMTLDMEPLFSIEGDQKLIKEVIINLIENAIKYSPTQTEIVIRTEETDKWVKVSVRDQGMGISPEDLPRVREKFFRSPKVQEQITGTGLGLYLANYFVELHHGSLTIESEVGKGTLVTFSLPIDSKQ
jgi:two-component system, OmpR family, phosphate regulon sensor histidine kinase PhoR